MADRPEAPYLPQVKAVYGDVHVAGQLRPVSAGRESLEVDDEDGWPALHRVPFDAPRARLASAARRLLVAVQGLL